MKVADRPLSRQMLPETSHPNYGLWANYARFARDRGKLTADILASYGTVREATILDIGCGEGGSAFALAQCGARVIAVDFHPQRVRKLALKIKTAPNVTVLQGDAQSLPFAKPVFDWILLQDVIEHLPNPEPTVRQMAAVLKPGGRIYLSTPNRWSPLNFIADPHWNLPVVSVLPRQAVKRVVQDLWRRERSDRPDTAALLSLPRLTQLLRANHLQPHFVNTHIAQALFAIPTSVVNSDLHLRIVAYLKKLHLETALKKLVNDRFGFFNYVVNPTWYIVAQKKSSA